MNIEEISNNVNRFTAVNKTGNKVEFTNSDYDAEIKRIISEAFDLELQICSGINKLIFDTFLILLDDNLIKDKKYEPEIFGSWIIRLKNKRIILDGKESILSLEKRNGFLRTDWADQKSIQIRDRFRYEDIVQIINEI